MAKDWYTFYVRALREGSPADVLIPKHPTEEEYEVRMEAFNRAIAVEEKRRADATH